MERLVSTPPPSITFSLPLVAEPRFTAAVLPIQIEKLARVYARAQARPQFAPAHGEGDFEILRCLGAGPTGVVYRARQMTLNRPIVLKVYHGEAGGTVASTLPEHEHITRVYAEAFDPKRGLRFLTLQYIAGLSLAQLTDALEGRRLASGAELLAALEEKVETPLVFNPSFAREREWIAQSRFEDVLARIGARLADALDFAHRHGVAHRNLKAENILIDGYGRPYLTDFAPRTGTPVPLVEEGIAWAAGPSPLDEQRAREAFDREEGREDVRQLWQLLSDFYRRHAPVKPPRSARTTLPAVTLEEVLPDDSASASQWRASLEAFEELRALQASLPPLGIFLRAAARFPMLTLLGFRLLPHLFGTTICTVYCTLRPGMPLSAHFSAIMQHVARLYSAISYPTGMFLVFFFGLPLARAFRALGRKPIAIGHTAPGVGDAHLADLRRRALRLPRQLALVNTGTWLPSIAVLTGIAYHLTHKFNLNGFLHFAFAVILAYLISTAYSTLYVLFFSVQVLYPRFIEPRPGLRARAANELREVSAWIRWLPFWVAAIPLTAAFLMLQEGPGDLLPERMRLIQLFLLTLIVGGGLGFLFSLAAIQRLLRIVRAIGGTD